MNFKYRVKVLGYTVDQLLTMGFSVNTHDCKTGELWAIACSGSDMQHLIKKNALELKLITSPEAIR